jgi:hypothetical protein
MCYVCSCARSEFSYVIAAAQRCFSIATYYDPISLDFGPSSLLIVISPRALLSTPDLLLPTWNYASPIQNSFYLGRSSISPVTEGPLALSGIHRLNVSLPHYSPLNVT